MGVIKVLKLSPRCEKSNVTLMASGGGGGGNEFSNAILKRDSGGVIRGALKMNNWPKKGVSRRIIRKTRRRRREDGKLSLGTHLCGLYGCPKS